MKVSAVLVGIGCIAAILFGLVWLGGKQDEAMHRPSNDMGSISEMLLGFKLRARIRRDREYW